MGVFKWQNEVVAFKNGSEDIYLLSVSSLACKLHMNTSLMGGMWTNCHRSLIVHMYTNVNGKFLTVLNNSIDF